MDQQVSSATISSTTDYDVFSLCQGNRPISTTHVNKLKAAILEKNLMYLNPLKVDNQFRVIDGQHRLQACRDLGIPVYYVCSDDLDNSDLSRLNTVKKLWSLDNFLNLYVSQGIQSYITVQKLIEEHPYFKIKSAIELLADDTFKVVERFRNGQYTTGNIEDAGRTAAELKGLQAYGPHTMMGSFIKAYLILKSNEKWNFKLFVRAVNKQPTAFVKCISVDAYLQLFEKLWNHGKSKESHISL
jgi:hypothetical protein